MDKAEEVLEMLKGLLGTQGTNSPDIEDEDEREEELPNWAFIALLEAISIIVEKCETTEERVEAHPSFHPHIIPHIRRKPGLSIKAQSRPLFSLSYMFRLA